MINYLQRVQEARLKLKPTIHGKRRIGQWITTNPKLYPDESLIVQNVRRGHVMRGAKTLPTPTHLPYKFSFSLFIEIVR